MSKSKIRLDSFYHKVDKTPILGIKKGPSVFLKNGRRSPSKIEYLGKEPWLKIIGNLIYITLFLVSSMIAFFRPLFILSTVFIFFPVVFFGFFFSKKLRLRVKHPPLILDKNEGYFWVGEKAPWEVNDLSEIKRIGRLSDVYCVQVINYKLGASFCFQLNIVLKNGNRIRISAFPYQAIFPSPSHRQVIEEGKSIAKFLKVPFFQEEVKSK